VHFRFQAVGFRTGVLLGAGAVVQLLGLLFVARRATQRVRADV